MSQVIGFDVYGTLVDPVDMGRHLGAIIGAPAKIFDPWEFEPDLVVKDLIELSAQLV